MTPPGRAATTASLRRTTYAATPTRRSTACHDSLAAVADVTVAVRPVGRVGVAVSEGEVVGVAVSEGVVGVAPARLTARHGALIDDGTGPVRIAEVQLVGPEVEAKGTDPVLRWPLGGPGWLR